MRNTITYNEKIEGIKAAVHSQEQILVTGICGAQTMSKHNNCSLRNVTIDKFNPTLPMLRLITK